MMWLLSAFLGESPPRSSLQQTHSQNQAYNHDQGTASAREAVPTLSTDSRARGHFEICSAWLLVAGGGGQQVLVLLSRHRPTKGVCKFAPMSQISSRDMLVLLMPGSACASCAVQLLVHTAHQIQALSHLTSSTFYLSHRTCCTPDWCYQPPAWRCPEASC